MLRVGSVICAGLWVALSGPGVAAQERTDLLYGIDFMAPYQGSKTPLDTRVMEGLEITLHEIDDRLGGQSYLVETGDGEICEFATILPLEPGITEAQAFDLVAEMQSAAREQYGTPSETSGPGGNVSDYIWRAGQDGARLPQGVATLKIALGWASGTPVVAFLKANHHRCEGISAIGLP
jgi:hypothetical protein